MEKVRGGMPQHRILQQRQNTAVFKIRSATAKQGGTVEADYWYEDKTACQLDSGQLLDMILIALENNNPLSVVSVGQTEAFVMAQYGIYSEKEFMSHREAYNANLGIQSGFMHRGIRFPNRAARDAAVAAVKKADIIAYNTIEDNARDLTLKVFAAYNIIPKYYFEANIRRVFMFSQRKRFEAMLRGRKILLISSIAPEAKQALEAELEERLGFKIVGAVTIFEHEEIPRVKAEIDNYSFDLCFLAAGVNATILAPYIAEKYGKVAFDIGWGMKSFITGEITTDSFITEVIGMKRLYEL